MAEENYTLNDARGRRPRFHMEMDGSVMKLVGCVTMLCYSVSRTVIQNGLLHANGMSRQALSDAMASDPQVMSLAGLASVLQLIGGLAIPLFAFLLVEGFVHTASFKRYLLTMAAFAAVSEVPYDLAMYGRAWDMLGQNMLLSYVLCLVMLYGLRLLQGKKGLAPRLGQAVIVAAAVLWTMLLQSGFGLVTVLLTAVYYLWYDQKGVRVLLGCAVSILYVTAPLSGYAIYNYNGSRGRVTGRKKYIFYALYPVHLLILALIVRML